MSDADKIFRKLRQNYRAGKNADWKESRENIIRLVNSEIYSTKRKFLYKKIEEYFPGNKDIKILDFGCGGGQAVIYLYFMGYHNACGADIHPQTMNIGLSKKLGIEDILFFEYDGKTLPFKENSFDLVMSEQVLEHVFDIVNYYSEASRILKKGGIGFFSFPHRLIPYDTHSRTWFIHYFPPRIREYLFRIFGRDPDVYKNKLNLRTIRYHKDIASRFFSTIINETKERLLSFDEKDLARYEGNIFLRSTIDKMIKSKISGPLLLPLLSKISMVNFCMFK